MQNTMQLQKVSFLSQEKNSAHGKTESKRSKLMQERLLSIADGLVTLFEEKSINHER